MLQLIDKNNEHQRRQRLNANIESDAILAKECQAEADKRLADNQRSVELVVKLQADNNKILADQLSKELVKKLQAEDDKRLADDQRSKELVKKLQADNNKILADQRSKELVERLQAGNNKILADQRSKALVEKLQAENKKVIDEQRSIVAAYQIQEAEYKRFNEELGHREKPPLTLPPKRSIRPVRDRRNNILLSIIFACLIVISTWLFCLTNFVQDQKILGDTRNDLVSKTLKNYLERTARLEGNDIKTANKMQQIEALIMEVNNKQEFGFATVHAKLIEMKAEIMQEVTNKIGDLEKELLNKTKGYEKDVEKLKEILSQADYERLNAIEIALGPLDIFATFAKNLNELDARVFAPHGVRLYGCFPENTQIQIDEIGNMLPVQDIRRGFRVWNPHYEGLIQVKRSITGPEIGYLLQFTFSDGTSINVTKNHAMISKNDFNAEWENLSAQALNIGAFIPTNFGVVQVLRIEKISIENSIPVYNFELDMDENLPVWSRTVIANKVYTLDLFAQEQLV